MNVSELSDGDTLRVPLSVLVEAPWGNVRSGPRDTEKQAALFGSVKEKGVLQSITVRPNEDDNTLEVLAGYGRKEASVQAGFADIPVLVKCVSDKEGMAIGLAENLNREDLSIVQEIVMSQSYLSLYDGDYEEAAKAIGWPVTRLKGRLVLNDCDPLVLAALADRTIKIGHAEVLCQFTAKLQKNTLAKIIDEGWSVKFLKKRANKANRLLRQAKFDTADCASCPHNSDRQSTLFDSHIGGGKCGNLPCFSQKTQEWLEAQKTELEREEGVVLFAIEKPESHRQTVSSEIVGKDAFHEDCLGCVSRVRIMQDGINNTCGDVIENQCINLSCFKEKIAAKSKIEASKKLPQKTNVLKKKTRTRKGDLTAKTVGKAKVPAAVTDQAEQFVRDVVGRALLDTNAYRLALTLSALCEMTGYKPKGKRHAAIESRISHYSAMNIDELNTEILAAQSFGTSDGASSINGFDGTKVVLKSVHHIAQRNELVTQAWEPNKEWFDRYLKGGIEGLCRQKAVGFSAAYEKEHGKGSFKTLMNRKKSDIIDTVLAFPFDWSEIVPMEVAALVK